MSIVKRITSATKVWNSLNGIINVYKPAGMKLSHVRNTVIGKICRDLNQLEVRAPRYRVNIESATNENFKVKVEEDIADSVLAVGDRYQLADIKCIPAASLGEHTSGVLRINNGTKISTRLHRNRPIRVYHVTGKLGIATETNFADSRVISRATYRHINFDKLNNLLSSMQASHQRKMFEICGVDIQSQAAFDLAIKGTIRPESFKIPVIYGLKGIQFSDGQFVLEVHALNETEEYLATLVHEIGLQLHSVAHCISIRCIRHGHFTTVESLLRHNWNLQDIQSNMALCDQILFDHPVLLKNTNSNLV